MNTRDRIVARAVKPRVPTVTPSSRRLSSAASGSSAMGKGDSDVRADVRFVNVLVWRQECLEVTAAAS